MNVEQAEQRSLHVSREKFLAFVSEMLGTSVGREDDDHPLPPGPWDPVIRAALERTHVFGPSPEPWSRFGPLPDPWLHFGPHPEPWRTGKSIFTVGSYWKGFLASTLTRHPEIYDAIGGGHNPMDEVALNPQPLPPRVAFMVSAAQVVTARAELLQELADATAREGERRGIIIVGGYVSRFCDDWCGNGFRLKWPFPGPRPSWFASEPHGIDLVVLATQFEQSAKDTFSPELRRNLADASARLVEAGLSKMD
jgi:hypothetical protein